MFENKILCLVLAIALELSISCAVVQSYRLDGCREQLEQYRVELSASRSRLADASAVVARARESISTGTDSVAGLREQIAAIRKAFEDMEDCLNSSNRSSSDNDNSGGD